MQFMHMLRLAPAGLILIALLFPLAAFAQDSVRQAGFAPGSLWLSKASAVSGEELTVYTVIRNSSTGSVEGEVRFSVDGSELAKEPFRLVAGESKILSAPWKASAGTHTFSATIHGISGAAEASVLAEATGASISVSAPPPSPVASVITSASSIIASSSPALMNAISPVAGATESIREAGIRYLSDALYDATSSSATLASEEPRGQVLGEEIAQPASTVHDEGALESFKRAALNILLTIFQSKILFYLSLLFVLYILYKLVRAFFRERSSY